MGECRVPVGATDKFGKPVFSFAERWRKKLVALNEVGGPEGDSSRVGLRLLLPLGDAGARAVGREHQPVGLGGADGLCRRYGRSVQNGPDKCRPETLRKLEIIGTNSIAQAFDAASKRPLREHKLPHFPFRDCEGRQLVRA